MSWITNALQWFGYGIPPGSSSALPSSIYADGSLDRIVLADIFGTDVPRPVSRSEAMSLAPVGKGRHIVCGTIASTPLQMMLEATGDPLPYEQQPWWLNHTDGVMSPYQRLTWTLDDGLFYGESLWRVERLGGVIVRAWHVPYATWTVTPDGNVEIAGVRKDPSEYLYFPFHVESLLVRAERTMRMALAIEQGVEERAVSPIPLSVLQSQGPDSDLTQEQATTYVQQFRAARATQGGRAAMYLPSALKLEVYGDRADSGHAIEARNAVRLDVANHIGIPASRLDGSEVQSSLTYTTQEGDQQELASATGLGPWMTDITSRLSQDDVSPAGYIVRFHAGQMMQADPVSTPQTRDQVQQATTQEGAQA